MELNADFSQRAVVHAAQLDWVASPMPGVDRRMLDRLGDEVARATSIVRYAPHSTFSAHTHSGGEEFLVLEGVFQDEHGDYPAGTYVRNPPQSKHTPGSEPGCTILVKLWQFSASDPTFARIDTNKMAFVDVAGREGVEVMPLFSDGREDVSLERWSAGAILHLDAPNGIEVFVLEGSFSENGEEFAPHSWLRLPKGGAALITAGPSGAKLWIKRDHLAEYPSPPAV
jgi:anti-sigma factor ChrR (cupin superfamily)